MRDCCGNCRHFRPRKPDELRPAGAEPDYEGRCGFPTIEYIARYRRRSNWCDQHQRVEPPDDNSDLL